MPLDFLVLGFLGLGLYALTYFFLRRRLSRLGRMLPKAKEQIQLSDKSTLIGWVFQGRGGGQERLAKLFSVFPPLMLIVTASGLILVFLTSIAFLRVATSIGSLVAALIFAIPYYRVADAFDMLVLVGVAERTEINRFSNDDVSLLETAQAALSSGLECFGRLSFLLLLVLGLVFLIEPFSDRILTSLYPPLSRGLTAFVGLVAVVLVGTYMVPVRAAAEIKQELEQTREIAMPLAGDHLSYGAVWTLEATRSRLMRKFRLAEESGEDKSELSADNRQGPKYKPRSK